MIYILLPSYNEEKGLAELLPVLERLIRQQPERFKVVVVDDGSRDQTSKVALSFSRRLDLKLIRFEKNRGVGEVFKEGFRFVCEDSREPEEDICVALDSDNTQDPKTMFELIEKVRDGEDLVIASRFEGGGHMVGCPWHRSLYSYGVSWLMRTVTRLARIKDYSIFYRAYRVSLLKEGFERYGGRLLAGRGFAVMAGLLLKLANLTTRISEVPFILRYDLKTGTSGNKIFKTLRGYVELIFDYLSQDRYRKDLKPILPAEVTEKKPKKVLTEV